MGSPRRLRGAVDGACSRVGIPALWPAIGAVRHVAGVTASQKVHRYPRMMLSERPGRGGWFRRAFLQASHLKPDPDAPYLDVLLWCRREYLRSLRISIPALILFLPVAVAIGTLGLFVFAVLFVLWFGMWMFTLARVSWRIARARREPRDEFPTYPTTSGS
jgi:hypothetical protein